MRELNGNHWLCGHVLEGRKRRVRIVAELDGQFFGRELDHRDREVGDYIHIREDDWAQFEALVRRGP